MKKIKSLGLFATVGSFINVTVVGGVSYVLALFPENGMKAPQVALELFKEQPYQTLKLLFDPNHPVNDFYTSPELQITFWLTFLFLAVKKPKGNKNLTMEDASEYGSHGTSRWEKDIKRLRKKEGMIVGAEKRLFSLKPLIQPVDGNNNHMTLVYGGAGSGKTAGFSIPNILHISETLGESFVITDPKGDIYKATRNHLVDNGYNVIIVNLVDMTRSAHYNPMDYITKESDSMSLATTIMKNTSGSDKPKDSMWEQAEHALLSSLIQYLKECRPKEEQHIKNVLHIGNSIRKDPKKLDQLFNDLPDESAAKHLYNIFANSEDKTRSGILIGFASRLRLWALNDVSQLTATSDFDVNDLGEKKTALFIITPDADSTFDMITAMLIDQVFQELIRQANEREEKKLKVPVRMILDEVANIAPISDLKRRVAVMRSRGVRISLLFQGVQQFKNAYGEGTAAEISDSCDNMIVMAANDSSTSVPISKKLGSKTIKISSESHSGNKSGSSSGINYSFTGRALKTPDEIETMPKEKCILFQKGHYPSYVNKYFYFKNKDWKDLEEYDWTLDNTTKGIKVKLFNINQSDNVVELFIEDEKKEDLLEDLLDQTEMLL